MYKRIKKMKFDAFYVFVNIFRFLYGINTDFSLILGQSAQLVERWPTNRVLGSIPAIVHSAKWVVKINCYNLILILFKQGKNIVTREHSITTMECKVLLKSLIRTINISPIGNIYVKIHSCLFFWVVSEGNSTIFL